MAVRSSFFNSVNGDRRYLANNFAEYFASFIANGIFPNPSNTLQVYEKTNMIVTVKPGKGWINGYFAVNEYDYDLTLENADGVLNRIDRIVLRLDFNARSINIAVKKGAFASTPVAPTLQRDADAHELALADIYVAKGTTIIKQSNIADQRLNNALCGVVHGTVSQVDTTTIFNQYSAWFAETTGKTESEINQWQLTIKAEFDTWFESIKNILDGDVAGNLAGRIASLEQEIATHQADNVSHDTYVSCSSASSTVEKVVSVIGFNLVEGARITVKFANANTATTPTLKVNTELSKPLVKADGTAFKNIKAGIYSFVYSGTSFTVQGEGGEYGNVTKNDVVAGKTFGTENGLQTGAATVASLGGIVSSDIALFSAIANENGYEVSEVDKNTGKIAYGSYSTIPMIGCIGDLNGKMISQKSVNTPSYVSLVGWYIDYYVTYLQSSGVITFYNHDDTVIFSFNYIVYTGIYGICLYQDTVVIVEYDRSTQTLLTTYKNKTGGTISSFSKVLSSNNFTLGKNLKLNLYKVPFIYQYGDLSHTPHFTVGLIKLNGINTITHKRFYGDFTEPSLRFLKDYITK